MSRLRAQALLAVAVLVSVALAGCAKEDRRDVTFEQMFRERATIANASKEPVKVVAPAHLDHLQHREWTTFVMVCSGKGGCIPIYTHHEADDWRVCETSDTTWCYEHTTRTWDKPAGDGPGRVYGTVKWDDCKWLWWSTCKTPHHETGITNVAYRG